VLGAQKQAVDVAAAESHRAIIGAARWRGGGVSEFSGHRLPRIGVTAWKTSGADLRAYESQERQ